MGEICWSLDGKAAVVTGASSGLGRGIAVALAEAGARTLLVGRDPARLDETAATIRDGGGDARVLVADLVADGAPAAVVAEAAGAFGAVDLLVHAAGVYIRQPFEEVTPEMLDWHWEINFRAPYALTQAALPHLREGSVVVFLSSVAGHTSIRNATAYATSKAALIALGGGLALELAPRGIRVNVVAPGFVETPMNEKLREDPAVVKTTLDASPLHRFGTVDDIAPVVVFLASDAARFVHGAVIRVDGGYPTAFAAPVTGAEA